MNNTEMLPNTAPTTVTERELSEGELAPVVGGTAFPLYSTAAYSYSLRSSFIFNAGSFTAGW